MSTTDKMAETLRKISETSTDANARKAAKEALAKKPQVEKGGLVITPPDPSK